jgi:hypothetical protein
MKNQRSNIAQRHVLKRRASNLKRPCAGYGKGLPISASKGGATVYRGVCCSGKTAITRFDAPVLPPSFKETLDSEQPKA